MEFHHIIPHDGDADGEGERHDDSSTSPDPPIWSEVIAFLSSHIILSIFKPDTFMLLFLCNVVHMKLCIEIYVFFFFAVVISIILLIFMILYWQIMRFFTNPRKPMILALARADPKKNITTLVKAFGECRPLRELANLVCSNFLTLPFYHLFHNS